MKPLTESQLLLIELEVQKSLRVSFQTPDLPRTNPAKKVLHYSVWKKSVIVGCAWICGSA